MDAWLLFASLPLVLCMEDLGAGAGAAERAIGDSGGFLRGVVRQLFVHMIFMVLGCLPSDFLVHMDESDKGDDNCKRLCASAAAAALAEPTQRDSKRCPRDPGCELPWACASNLWHQHSGCGPGPGLR